MCLAAFGSQLSWPWPGHLPQHDGSDKDRAGPKWTCLLLQGQDHAPTWLGVINPITSPGAHTCGENQILLSPG